MEINIVRLPREGFESLLKGKHQVWYLYHDSGDALHFDELALVSQNERFVTYRRDLKASNGDVVMLFGMYQIYEEWPRDKEKYQAQDKSAMERIMNSVKLIPMKEEADH